MTRRRYVYHLCGYGPIGAGWYRVFKRELATFARTWNVSSQLSEPSPHPGTSSTIGKSRPRAPTGASKPDTECWCGTISSFPILRGRSPDASQIVAGLPRYHADGVSSSVLQSKLAIWPFLSVPLCLAAHFPRRCRRDRPLRRDLAAILVRAAGCLVRHAECGHLHHPVALARAGDGAYSTGWTTGFFRGNTCTAAGPTSKQE